MFESPEAVPIHTLSKLHYLIHGLQLINHLSFQELLNFGTHCHPPLSLDPTICHLLNLTSANLTLSPLLFKLPLILSVFSLSGLCCKPYGLYPKLLLSVGLCSNIWPPFPQCREITYHLSLFSFHFTCSRRVALQHGLFLRDPI